MRLITITDKHMFQPFKRRLVCSIILGQFLSTPIQNL